MANEIPWDKLFVQLSESATRGKCARSFLERYQDIKTLLS